MTKKIVLWIMAALLLGALLLGAYYLGRRPPINTYTEVTHEHHTVTPVETKIIYRNVPAELETLYVDGHEYIYARHHAVIDTNKVHVEVDIGYDELKKTFDVSHRVNTQRDSVYVEKIVTITQAPKPKLLGLTAALGVGFQASDALDPTHASFDFGVKIVDKYRATLFVDTRQTYGLRLGIDF